jgi:hypothetical protein
VAAAGPVGRAEVAAHVHGGAAVGALLEVVTTFTLSLTYGLQLRAAPSVVLRAATR